MGVIKTNKLTGLSEWPMTCDALLVGTHKEGTYVALTKGWERTYSTQPNTQLIWGNFLMKFRDVPNQSINPVSRECM